MKIKEAKSLPQMIDDTRPILDAVNNAMTIADINGSIVYKNEAYNRMLKRGNVEFVSDRKTIGAENYEIGMVTVYHDISEINRLKKELDRVNQRLRKAEVKYTFKDIIGKNPDLLKVIETAKVAQL